MAIHGLTRRPASNWSAGSSPPYRRTNRSGSSAELARYRLPDRGLHADELQSSWERAAYHQGPGTLQLRPRVQRPAGLRHSAHSSPSACAARPVPAGHLPGGPTHRRRQRRRPQVRDIRIQIRPAPRRDHHHRRGSSLSTRSSPPCTMPCAVSASSCRAPSSQGRIGVTLACRWSPGRSIPAILPNVSASLRSRKTGADCAYRRALGLLYLSLSISNRTLRRISDAVNRPIGPVE